MNQKGASSIVLIVVVLVVLAAGIGYWMWMQNSAPRTSETPNLPSITENTNSGDQAPLNSTPNNEQPAVRIQLLGLTSESQTVLPVLRYRVDGNVGGNGYISIISKNSGTIIWGMEQEPTGTHSLDLNTLTAIDGSEVKVPTGDYFLRIQDRSGNLLTESTTFHVAPGVMGN